jgi:hypothetical protein
LAGYIKITLSPSFYSSYLHKQRAMSAILQSLVVRFEGQSEVVTEETGYSALRICSISQELVPEEAIELNDDGYDGSNGLPCTWNVVFDLTIPGWLPETSAFGQRKGGTRYALYATAMLYNGDSSGSSSWISTFCSPFRSQSRIAKAPYVSIQLGRYHTPPNNTSESTSLWPFAQYSISPEIISTDTPFPIDLSKLRVQASVPEYVDIEEGCMPFSMRMRTDGLSDAESDRLRVTEFDVEIEQCERYRYVDMLTLSYSLLDLVLEQRRWIPTWLSSRSLQGGNNLLTYRYLILILLMRCMSLASLQSLLSLAILHARSHCFQRMRQDTM